MPEMSDAQVVRRYQELQYRMIECAIDPEHPTTRANRARWTREFRQVEAIAARRGMFKESAAKREP